MATGKPTNNNRAAQQAKLRRAKSGKHRTAHKLTTRKTTMRTQMGGVFPKEPIHDSTLSIAERLKKLLPEKDISGKYVFYNNDNNKWYDVNFEKDRPVATELTKIYMATESISKKIAETLKPEEYTLYYRRLKQGYVICETGINTKKTTEADTGICSTTAFAENYYYKLSRADLKYVPTEIVLSREKILAFHHSNPFSGEASGLNQGARGTTDQGGNETPYGPVGPEYLKKALEARKAREERERQEREARGAREEREMQERGAHAAHAAYERQEREAQGAREAREARGRQEREEREAREARGRQEREAHEAHEMLERGAHAAHAAREAREAREAHGAHEAHAAPNEIQINIILFEKPVLNYFEDKYKAIAVSFDDHENPLIKAEDFLNINDTDFKQKNRYSNVLPYKNTRVKLAPHLETNINSYINANYVNLGDRKYIATQGPLRHTIDDFWAMIWQEDTPVICMVTGLTERGQLKCADYFLSEDGGLFTTNTGMTVSVVKTSTPNEEGIEDIEERTITLTKDGQTKMVQHLWFRVWPDHGVPENTETTIDLSNRIDKYTKASTKQCAPVIHCSAGIGRTGTIMAINYLLSLPNETFTNKEGFNAVVRSLGLSPTQFVNNNNTENLSNLMALVLEKMRRQRPQMIQTEDQYFFVYQTIQAFYSTPRYYVRLARNECNQRAIGNESSTQRSAMMLPLAAAPSPSYPSTQRRRQQPNRPPATVAPATAAPARGGPLPYILDHYRPYDVPPTEDTITQAGIKGDKIIYINFNYTDEYYLNNPILNFTLGKANRVGPTDDFKIDESKQYIFPYYINSTNDNDKNFKVFINFSNGKDFINIFYRNDKYKFTSKNTRFVLSINNPNITYTNAKKDILSVINEQIKEQEKSKKQTKKSHSGGAMTITCRTKGKSRGTQKRHTSISKKTKKCHKGKTGNKTTMKSGAW